MVFVSFYLLKFFLRDYTPSLFFWMELAKGLFLFESPYFWCGSHWSSTTFANILLWPASGFFWRHGLALVVRGFVEVGVSALLSHVWSMSRGVLPQLRILLSLKMDLADNFSMFLMSADKVELWYRSLVLQLMRWRWFEYWLASWVSRKRESWHSITVTRRFVRKIFCHDLFSI